VSFKEIHGKLRNLANSEKAKVLRGRTSQRASQEDAGHHVTLRDEEISCGKEKAVPQRRDLMHRISGAR
jgi:hypothetical protein